MSSSNTKDDDDKDLFRQATSNVRPLRTDKHHLQRQKPKPKSVPQRQQPRSGWSSNEIDQKDWLGSEDSLHFAKTGIQHKIIRQMKRGNIPIEGILDLHQQTVDEAMTNVNEFINQCVSEGKRWVCLIHGKGRLSSGSKPVLKNFLNQWLREQSNVLAFHSAQPRHGGTGALYVLLKRAPHEK